MLCLNCNTENDANAKFCMKCGSPLPSNIGSNNENIQNQTFFQTPVGNTQNVETQNNSFFQVPLNSNPNMVPNDSMNSVSPMPSGQSPNSGKKKISMKDWILNHKKVILIVLGIS